MATVYLAGVGTGPLARMCAVKLLRANLPDHDYRTRFLDEARLVVRHKIDVPEARELAAKGEAKVSSKKVEALKAAISDGSFKVDSHVVANRLLDTLG